MNKLLLVDEKKTYSERIHQIFSSHFPEYSLHTAGSSSELVMELNKAAYEAALIIIGEQDFEIFTLLPVILKLYPQMAIGIIGDDADTFYVQKLYREGARAFIGREEEEEEMSYAIGMLLQRKIYINERIKNFLVMADKEDRLNSPFEKLSQRESEVARFLLAGKRISEISREMGLKPNTVTTYKIKIFEKLSIENIIQLKRLESIYKPEWN